MLWHNRDVFYEYEHKMGCYDGEKIDINLIEGAQPIAKRPYRIHPKFDAMLEKEIEELKKAGVIEDSTAEWASPALVLEKKGQPNEIRLVCDFREINKLIQKDKHPLPRVDDIFNQLAASKPKYFTCLDMKHGYFQIQLTERSKDLTTFVTPRHCLRFTRVPMGICVSGAKFQRIMYKIFRGMVNRSVCVYLDDILVYSDSFEEHVNHLREVFSRIRQACLKIKASKTKIIARELKFLGFQISNRDKV